MTTLNIRLTDWIEQRLNEEAARENKTRSEVARDALTWYLTEIKKNALHGIPGRSARSIRQRKYPARSKINRGRIPAIGKRSTGQSWRPTIRQSAAH